MSPSPLPRVTHRRAVRTASILSVLALILGEGRTDPVPVARANTADTASTGEFPFPAYEGLLKKYVDKEGRVDYQGLKAQDTALLNQFATTLSMGGPDKTPALYSTRDAALAYYLTAYNVLVWKNVVDRLPNLKQVNESLYRFFRSPDFPVDGRTINLDDLEKKVIRKRFNDPRVHFALNCASGGCPRLPREAFTPQKVQSQLDRESRFFCNEKRNVDLDAATNKLQLSMIFKWYRDDFGGSEISVVRFINKYRAANAQIPENASISYVDYDWRLNDRQLPNR